MIKNEYFKKKNIIIIGLKKRAPPTPKVIAIEATTIATGNMNQYSSIPLTHKNGLFCPNNPGYEKLLTNFSKNSERILCLTYGSYFKFYITTIVMEFCLSVR